MDDARTRFFKRAKAVQSTHKKLAQGYVTKVDKNGVVQHKPVTHIRGAALLNLFPIVAIFLAMKGFVLSKIGMDAYEGHLATLQQGSMVEQFGAKIMALDPVTRWLAETISVLASA